MGGAAFRDARIRVVLGAIIRAGAYIAPGAVLDSWSTVGFNAQLGAHCHISGGVGLDGVIEPIGDNPVVIEDNVFIGARSEVAEGVTVCSRAVIGMGISPGASTLIIDRVSVEVPTNAVVIVGNRDDPKLPGVSLACAVIVKYADECTRSKTALSDLVRELNL